MFLLRQLEHGPGERLRLRFVRSPLRLLDILILHQCQPERTSKTDKNHREPHDGHLDFTVQP